MIELYISGNDNFDNNGDYILDPSFCEVSAELNGTWSLDLEHPIDPDGKWQAITEESVIKAPSFNGEQLWRVYAVTITERGVSASAYPIFLDAAQEVFLVDTRPTAQTGQGALNAILAGSNYYGISNITRTATAYYIRQNALEAIAGTADNSFLHRWGGEISYDNFGITIDRRLGSNRGFRIAYGENIAVDGIEKQIDASEVVTRIVPVAYNGYTLAGNSPWVDSPLINDYPVPRTKVYQYDNIRLEEDVAQMEDTTGLEIYQTLAQLRTALAAKAAEEFSENHVDLPRVSFAVDVVFASSLKQNDDIIFENDPTLGDTVTVVHKRLDIEQELRVTKIEYNCLRDRVEAVTVGDPEPSFITKFTKQSAEAQAAAAIDGSSDEAVRIVTKGANGEQMVMADATITADYTRGSLSQSLKIAVGQIVQQMQNGANLGQIAATALDGLELMFNRIKWLILNPRLGVIRAREYASAVQTAGDVEDYTETTVTPTGLTISEYDYNAGTKKDLASITQNAIEFRDANGNYTGTFNGIDLSTLGKKVELTNAGTAVNSVSVPTGTAWQDAATFTMPAGIYLLEVVARFDSNATGFRGVNMSASGGGTATNILFQDIRRAVSGTYTFVRFATIISTSSTITRHINLVQNSGSALNANIRYRFTKIGEV